MSSKEDLKNKLKLKLEAKKKLRSGKKHLKNETFKVNNNEDIYRCSVSLMETVKVLNNKGIKNHIKIDKIVSKKYDFLKKKYFAIYRAILLKELPIQILQAMLNQKSRIDNKEISEKDASFEMGSMFAKKLNVDIDSIVKNVEKKE